MAQKQDVGKGMRVLLVTSDPIEYHQVLEDNYTILPHDLRTHDLRTETLIEVKRDNRYVQEITRREIGLPVVIYETNLPTARTYLEKIELSGLVVPVGHGDINIIINLGFESPEKVGIPVFEAYKHYPGYRGYEGRLARREIIEMDEETRQREVMNAFKVWVIQHWAQFKF